MVILLGRIDASHTGYLTMEELDAYLFRAMTDDDLKQPDLTSQKSPGGHTRQHVLAHAHTHERTCTRVPALPLKLALPGGKWPGLAQQNLRRYCSAASLEQVRKFRLKGRRKSQRPSREWVESHDRLPLFLPSC